MCIRDRTGDELGELYKRLESIRCEVYDLAETIRDKRAEFAFSPAELDAAEARTDQLYRLKKKYGATVEDMIAYLEPVSYTHLDVYKRQGVRQRSAGGQARNGGPQ